MSTDVMTACADMNLADAIEDMAAEKGITLAEARDRILESDAYECLYDFDTKLWAEGPDYFRWFLASMQERPADGHR